MLRTGCIKNPRRPEDGLRVSVMSRHTLADGVTPDPEITDALFDEHWVILAPPPTLVGDYYKRGLSWGSFAVRYAKYLEREDVQPAVWRIIELAKTGNITVLCIEPSPEQCHRRLLAAACATLDPALQVLIR